MARTITSVNVALGFSYENFKKGVDGSISSWKMLQKIGRDSVPELDRYNKALAVVEQGFETGAIGAKQYGLMIDQVNYSFKQGEYAVSRYSSMIEKLSSWQTGAGSSASRMIRQLDAWSAGQKEIVQSEKDLVELEKQIDAGIKKRAAKESADAAKLLADAQKQVNSVLAMGLTKMEKYQIAMEAFKSSARQAKISAEDLAKGIAIINNQFGVSARSDMINKLSAFAGKSDSSKMIAQLSAWQGGREASGAAASERIAQLQKEAMTIDEVRAARMNELDSLRAAGLDSQTYWRHTKQLNDELAKQAGIVSGGGEGRTGASLTSALRTLGLQYYAISQAISAVSSGVRTAFNFERQTIAFASLTGSIEESQKMMEGFLELSAKAPLSITAMQGGARTMLSFGASAREAGAAVEMIARITGGDEMRFQNMSLAFSQIRAATRLMGQELRQMIDAGFNPLEQISKQTGISMLDLRKRMEQGGISFEMVRQAMEEATTGGGRFATLLEDISGTASGKLQKAIAQATKMVIDFSKYLDFDIGNTVEGIGSLAKVLGTILAPVGFVVVKMLSGLSVMVQAAQKAIEGWGYIFSWLTEKIDSFLPAGAKLADVFQDFTDIFGYSEEQKHFERLLNEPPAASEAASDAQKAADAYKALSDATQAASDATNEYYDELSGRFSEALKASGKYTDAQLKIAEIEAKGIKLADSQKKGIIDRTEAIEKFEAKVKSAQDALAAIEKQQEAMQDLMKELRPQDEAARGVEDLISQISQMDQMFGLENLGVTMDDIRRVVSGRAGGAQSDSLDYRLGEAVQSGSSAAIQKLYDFQVKQDTSEILGDISQTSRDQLELLRQKLEGGIVLSGARP